MFFCFPKSVCMCVREKKEEGSESEAQGSSLSVICCHCSDMETCLFHGFLYVVT